MKMPGVVAGHPGAPLAMTIRYASLSQERLRDSVNLLNDLPGGKETITLGPHAKKADNPSIANLF